MSTDENKNIVRKLIDARNSGDAGAFAALFPLDWQESVKVNFGTVTEAFPDVHITIEDLIGEQDKVVSRWSFQGTHLGLYQDVPATGKKVNYSGIDIYQIHDRKIVMLWRETDSVVVLQQIGATPSHKQKANL